MLTPCKSVENRQDDLSADEDILENTKPNLISFSLSTSSSNYTVSATNSSQRDVEVECFSGHQLSSFEHFRTSGEIKLPITVIPLTSPIADPPETIVSSCSDSSANANLFTEGTCTKCSKTDIFLESTSVKNNSVIVHSGVRSSSMCSLYENSLRNDMPRFASHPQLNAHLDSKRSILTRSLSSITLKHRSHAYDHVESKVKHYIKQLKRERVEANEHQEKSEVNVPPPKEDSVVIQLQQEVEKLQSYLEERDLLLQEVQANYHSLLLQYGEAKNKLDQLRFTSATPEQAAKSVQTQSQLKPYPETSLVDPYKTDQLTVLEKVVHESDNQISSPNKCTLSIIKDEKGQKENNKIGQNTEVNDTDHFKLDIEAKGSNGLSEENNTSYSPDMAALKVSSWFSSLPWQLLPVPSCYGSLGSSGNISNQLLDCAPTVFIDKNEDEKVGESSEQLWMKNCNSRDQPLEDHNVAVAEGENLCFPPMEKCYCWTLNNIQDCPILEGKSSVESVKDEMNNDPMEVLCVPPLDLERLNNTALPQGSSVSKHLYLSEDSLSSVCSQQSSFDEKCSFKPTRVANQMYLETPTSYKSIAINPGRAVEAKADDRSSVVSLCREQQSFRKNDHYLKSSSIKSNQKEGNWEKVNDQRPCCLKKIMQRCCVDDIHICYHWKKTSNHQLLRCEQCVLRDSLIPSDSQILGNLKQCLGNMSVCAEGLRKRSEAIESFLTNLLDSHL
ncbi:hypothetical protein R5R35_000373 [Gryllus longicercus]|uniref:Uncharacterized protein n=1 Tax=Gryllus longicercus TaxID=2509291 RepID=A0AAN9WQD8_9ORTH